MINKGNTVKYRKRECLRCGNEFEKEIELSRHTSNLSGEKTVYCPICGSKELISGEAKEK